MVEPSPLDDAVVHLDVTNGVATITLDSQTNRNALSRRLVEQLLGALTKAQAGDPRAIVLAHRGPSFCAGADLKERAATATVSSTDSNPFVDVLVALMDTPCPTIAAVDGAVRAGGIGLMAACDLVVVQSSTTFALTEVRIGVAAAIISVPILRRVPPAKIAAAMLTGEAFDAHEARAMGLVSHVTDDVGAVVAALCDGIRAGAPAAVAATKHLLRTVPGLERDEAFARMSALSNELFNGPDAAEGMAAFADKRSPSWATR